MGEGCAEEGREGHRHTYEKLETEKGRRERQTGERKRRTKEDRKDKNAEGRKVGERVSEQARWWVVVV